MICSNYLLVSTKSQVIFQAEMNKPGFSLNYICFVIHLRQVYLKFTIL